MVAAGGYTKGVCYWGFIKNEGTCKARAGYRAGYRARKYIREACTRKRGVWTKKETCIDVDYMKTSI